MKRQPSASKLMYRAAKSLKRGSFFYKLLSVVLLSTVLFSFINLGTMLWINRVMLGRETQTQIAYMDYSIKLINGNMAKIYNTIGALSIDTDIAGTLDGFTRLSRDYYEITGFRQIFNKLSTMRLDGNLFADLFIYVDKDDYVVTDEGVMDGDLFFKLRFGDRAAAWPALTQARNRLRIEPADLVSATGSSHTICILNTLYYNMRKIGTLVAVVNPVNLSDQSVFAGFTHDRPVCLMEADGNVVANLSGKGDSAFSLVPVPLEDRPVTLQRNGYLIRTEKISAGGLYLVVMTPMTLVTGSVSQVFNLTAMIIGATFVAGVLLSLLLSQHIYKPVLRLLDVLRGIGSPAGNVLQSEFDIIERNVMGILKNYEHMERAVVDSTPLLLEAVFKKIIAGERDRDTLDALLRELSIELRDGLYLAVAIRVRSLLPDGRQELEYFLGAGLGKLVRDHLGDNVISLFRMADDTLAAILYLKDEGGMRGVALHCDSLHEQITGGRSAFFCAIGVGNPTPDPYDISSSYGNAELMLEQCRVGNNRAVTVYDPAARRGSAPDEPIISNDMENRLYQYVLSGNGRMAAELAQNTLERNFALGVTLAAYKRLLATLQGYARRIYDALDAGGHDAVAFTDLVTEDEPSMDRASRAVLDNYRAIAEYYSALNSNDLIGRIVQYIDENLHRDIGLDEIADEVGLTSNYITRYFRKQKGVNFKNYVNSKRIDKARRLLSDTRGTVKDIAAQCGFNSSKRFIETFNKFVGATPSEYRRRRVPDAQTGMEDVSDDDMADGKAVYAG